MFQYVSQYVDNHCCLQMGFLDVFKLLAEILSIFRRLKWCFLCYPRYCHYFEDRSGVPYFTRKIVIILKIEVEFTQPAVRKTRKNFRGKGKTYNFHDRSGVSSFSPIICTISKMEVEFTILPNKLSLF